MPLLADIFSAGNTLKRRMKDFVADPRAFLETEVNYRNQKAGEFNTLQDLATQGDINKMRGLPVTQEQQAAELRLRDIVAGAYNPVGITVYHGSPYLFPRFDPMKVGTGEGAQAYGVGAGYTAEARPVAEEYKRQLGTKFSADNKLFYSGSTGKKVGSTGNTDADDYLLANLGNIDKAIVNAKQDMKEVVSYNPAEKTVYEKTISFLENLKSRGAVKQESAGYLYKGDIPDEILPKFLDWDKPIKKQPNVMAALRSEAEQRVRSQKLVEIENEIRGSIPSSNFGDDYLSMFRDVNVSVNQNIQKQAIEKLNKMDLSSLIEKELEAMKPRDMNWNMTGKDLYEFLAKNQGSAKQATTLLDRNGVRGIRYLDQASRGEGKGTSNYIPFSPDDFKIQEINDEPLEAWLKSGRLKVDESDPLMQFLGQK